MKVMKEMTEQIRSKGRMDAENRWWVAELLNAWLHPGRGRHHAKMVCVVGKDEIEG